MVANKYLTGFDQPKRSVMYVDKKRQGVLAVQALSRLNRAAPTLSKKTEDLFILYFFNTVDDIKTAFDPFYTATSLSRATDVNVLHELKDTLDEVGVYEWHEVEQFAILYFGNADAQQLSPIINMAAKRFNAELALEDEAKTDLKIKAKPFVKIYGQMASIMPFEIVDWEKLFWFLKFLIPKLIVHDRDADETEMGPQNPNPRGAHNTEEDRDPLDEIIREFNERWFQGWRVTQEEQRVKFFSIADSIWAHPDFEEKYQNNPDSENRMLVFEKASRKSCSRTAGPRWNSINCWPMMRLSRPPCSKACKG